MDAKGTIYHLNGEPVSDADLRRAGLIEIPEEQLAEIEGMNRKARRKWYAEQRSIQRKYQARERAKGKTK